MTEKQPKRMKSFRLGEDTAEYLRDAAERLGTSQADVIELALCAFSIYEIDAALECAAGTYELPADIDEYARLLYKSAYGDAISYPIRGQIDACAEDEARYRARLRPQSGTQAQE